MSLVVIYFVIKPSFLDNYANSAAVVPVLVDNLKCTKTEAKKLVEEHEENLNLLTLSELTKQLKMFLSVGIDKEILLKYPEIITMNPAMAKLKLDILKQLPVGENGNNLNDYFPLMRIPINDLKKVKGRLIKESSIVPRGSRIHFMSGKLSVEPYVMSAVFSNYLFLFRLPLRLIYSNTDILLEYKVPTKNILKDPWIYLYSTRRTRQRLAQAQKVREDKLMPWMIHCLPVRLESSLKLTSDMKAAHKEVDSEDVLGYISKRLGYERDEMEIFMRRFPPALKVRVTKIKSIIDFLLNEGGYSPLQIAAVPRILTFGLTQMKERHEELKALRYPVTSLTVFSFTKKKYNQFIERVKRHRHYLKRDKKSSNDDE